MFVGLVCVQAIIMFAPLLEGNRLENLLESAKKCYCDATNGLRGGEGEEGGLALTFKDPSCERLWLGVSACRLRHSCITGGRRNGSLALAMRGL